MGKIAEKEIANGLIKLTRYLAYLGLVLILALVALCAVLFEKESLSGPLASTPAAAPRVTSFIAGSATSLPLAQSASLTQWKAPEVQSLHHDSLGVQIRYGRELIMHTGRYFGPAGTISPLSNGMNCQNCHLEAGTKLFANTFAGFYQEYPKRSGRSGKVEPASQRIVECFERSLNGKSPKPSSMEMKSILAYMKWVGQGVKKGLSFLGRSTEKPSFLRYAADPIKGRELYRLQCASCHGNAGEGIPSAHDKTYINPPVWGLHSYNDGAGMYRLSNLAGFIKYNMPNGVSHKNPMLTDEQAWHLAAYINSQPRPHKDQTMDYPQLSDKPFDAPLGPYADRFSALQHKYGPYPPLLKARENLH